MDFDFHKQYRHYTVRQLLEITGNAASYQPAAVAAANELLELKDTRLVADEIERMNPMPPQLEEASIPSVFDESPPAYNPTHVMTVRALLAMIPVFFAARALWHFISFLLDSPENAFQLGVVMLLSPLITVSFYAGTAVLLWRRLGIGWYFGAIGATCSLISVLSTFLFLMDSDTGYYFQGLLLVNAVDIVLNGVMIFLLMMAVTRDTFDVGSRHRYWTIGVTAAVAIAYNYYRFNMLFGQ